MHQDTTQLLRRVRDGDREAFDHLFPRVYDELHRIAHQRLLRHRPGETINTTALVHEAYLKLVGGPVIATNDRAHFLALASRAMRFVLVNYAEARTAQKRGGGAARVPLDAVQIAVDDQATDLLALNDALDGLARHDERLGRLVEYRFFGGLTYDEIAAVTGLSVPTLKRDWVRAKGWLYRLIQAEAWPKQP